MPRTIILKPLEESYHDEESKLVKENSDKIKQVLDSMKYGENISFEDFLKKVGLTEESYLLVSCLSLHKLEYIMLHVTSGVVE